MLGAALMLAIIDDWRDDSDKIWSYRPIKLCAFPLTIFNP